MILVLPNVTIELSNVINKKGTIECDKCIVRNDTGTIQSNNGAVKCEEKKRVLLNVTKVQSNVMLVLTNVTMKPLDVREKIRETPNVTKE